MPCRGGISNNSRGRSLRSTARRGSVLGIQMGNPLGQFATKFRFKLLSRVGAVGIKQLFGRSEGVNVFAKLVGMPAFLVGVLTGT